ncbi:hypothetical protein BX070DRAFT_48133 [Coemansia spiralis]|nr:hypothetical protein BX070DRAFT_48133 [Coemansia spiralis]
MSTASTSAFSRLWNSPVGPKTIHFWAPAMKWGLVIAGLGDLTRPADQISVKQQLSLAATGLSGRAGRLLLLQRIIAWPLSISLLDALLRTSWLVSLWPARKIRLKSLRLERKSLHRCSAYTRFFS